MLISSGLCALLLGTSVAAGAVPLDAGDAVQGWKTRTKSRGLDIFNSTALSAFVEAYRQRHILPTMTPAYVVKFKVPIPDARTQDTSLETRPQGSEESCLKTPTICSEGSDGEAFACSGCSTCCSDGLGAFQCCGNGLQCCIDETGAGTCCSRADGASDGEGGKLLAKRATITSTVFATATVTRTVTLAPATQTAVVITTVAQTLTFRDPGISVRTAIVTATARLARRGWEISIPETAMDDTPSTVTLAAEPQPTITLFPAAEYDELEAQLAHMGVKVKRQSTTSRTTSRDETITVTSTTTTTVTTTIRVTTTITTTSTIFNTIFTTVTVAPSATETVTVTTTTTLPSGAPTVVPGVPAPAPEPSDTLPPPFTTILPPGSPTETEEPGSGGGQTSIPRMGTNTQVPPGASSSSVGRPIPGQSSTRTTPVGNPATTMPIGSSAPTLPNGAGNPAPGGSALSSDQIAGIVVGIVMGLISIFVIAFMVIRFVRRRQARNVARDQQEMTSGQSGATGGRSISNPQGGPGDGTGGAAPEGEVRIVIRPPVGAAAAVAAGEKRRTQSSGAYPPEDVRLGESAAWPRPPGYQGRPYSFFVEDSSDTTPADPQQWSNVSEMGSGSGSNPKASTRSSGGAGPAAPTRVNYSTDEDGPGASAGAEVFTRPPPPGGGGAGGGISNNFGRALSPHNVF